MTRLKYSPTPEDAERFLELVRAGVSPPDAARQLGYSGSSRFRSLGRRYPQFGAAYLAAKLAQRPRPTRAHARHTRKGTLLDFVDDWNMTLLTAAEFRVYTKIRAWCARHRVPQLTSRVARQLGLTPRRRARLLELGLLIELPDGQLALTEPDFDDRSIDLADGRLLEPADATSRSDWSD